ncbi:hypothetical protein [Taibaiella chishuiensis]|uniref:hypothetical protein n=1 Tax=Taibaiella chishuiensis TaxID=1434707 RepID=UPI000D0CF790|nr:hypothetical protein [Taibaiella chishuiensis]
MEALKVLNDFLRAIKDDSRVDPILVSVFIALFQTWLEEGCKNPFVISCPDIMPLAKISGKATYHRAMSALSSYGYIRYEPSKSNKKRSIVYLIVKSGRNSERDKGGKKDWYQ